MPFYTADDIKVMPFPCFCDLIFPAPREPFVLSLPPHLVLAACVVPGIIVQNSAYLASNHSAPYALAQRVSSPATAERSNSVGTAP